MTSDPYRYLMRVSQAGSTSERRVACGDDLDACVPRHGAAPGRRGTSGPASVDRAIDFLPCPGFLQPVKPGRTASATVAWEEHEALPGRSAPSPTSRQPPTLQAINVRVMVPRRRRSVASRQVGMGARVSLRSPTVLPRSPRLHDHADPRRLVRRPVRHAHQGREMGEPGSGRSPSISWSSAPALPARAPPPASRRARAKTLRVVVVDRGNFRRRRLQAGGLIPATTPIRQPLRRRAGYGLEQDLARR